MNISVGDEFKCVDHGYQFKIIEINSGGVLCKVSCGNLYSAGTDLHMPVREFQRYLDMKYYIPIEPTKLATQQIYSSSDKVVNNFICKRCGNERCNTEEKTCWRCGESLKP